VILKICKESPTFGHWINVELICDSDDAVFIAGELEDGFLKLKESAAVT
jgi:dTDP-4-dehydrorhamnose 3,5-epimerase-like enzyme